MIPGASGIGALGKRLNEAGEITGWTNYPVYDAYRWTEADGVELLPPLAGYDNGFAHDLNDAGMVVGISGLIGIESPQRAVRWVDGVPHDLGALEPGGHSQADALNDEGTVVGSASVGFFTHAFVWTEDEGMIDITPGGFGWARDINESGQVIGDDTANAFVWEDGNLRYLDKAPGFDYGYARAINDVGQVAGAVKVAGVDTERFARWAPDGEVEVLGGAGDNNKMFGINNDGAMVGTGVLSAGLDRGVIYTDEFGLEYIDDVVNSTEWVIRDAYDINDAGQLLVQGHHRFNGDVTALRLDPIDGPTMHEQGFTVRVTSGDRPKAIGKLRLIDEDGDPVRRAKVRAAWYGGGRAIDTDASDRTDRKGKAKLTYSKRDLGPPDMVELCIIEITHRRLTYVPTDGGPPPCARATPAG